MALGDSVGVNAVKEAETVLEPQAQRDIAKDINLALDRLEAILAKAKDDVNDVLDRFVNFGVLPRK